jgi:molybdenum transport protein
MRFSNARIDAFIEEDVPYIDLTCEVLGVHNQPGEMEYFTRESCVLAGTDIARRIMRNLGCEVLASSEDGQLVSAGQTFFTVRGAAADLHAAWKVCLNVFDHLSAVATKTRSMVDAVHAVNPECEVLTTRKSMPGAKDLLTCAVMAGGAFPHRLGLSETVLVFEQHLAFFGGFNRFVEEMPRIKARCVEKKLFVEADAQRALALARASSDGHGVDGIQLDKVPVSELAELVRRIREIDPRITIIAAGGINPQNAGAYAACGVDGLATTAPFTAKPVDMSVRMRPLEQTSVKMFPS